MPDRPVVGIGLTAFNRSEFLGEALDSLLGQSYRDFRLVIVDDGSTDATERVARSYAERDRRVQYARAPQRRGMIASWRSAFDLASPGADYFAWASDHDRWHPHWLEALLDDLERHPQAVLSYPSTQRIDEGGNPLPKPPRRFDTAGVEDAPQRWRQFSRSDAVAAGDMVYGLMRADAVRRAGVFRDVLCPDRLLVAELTLHGQIRQLPDVLWFRRQFSTGSVARQRSTLFAPGAAAPGTLTPPWYTHARSLWTTYGRDRTMPGVADRQVRPMVIAYAANYAIRHYAKTPQQRGVMWLLHLPRWTYKQVKHGALVLTHGTLVRVREAGITPRIEDVCERLTGRRRPWRRTS